MSRYSSAGSYGHRIANLGQGDYRLFWKVDHYYSGTRGRFPRVRSRDTNLKGAQRFAKKWNVKIPEYPS